MCFCVAQAIVRPAIQRLHTHRLRERAQEATDLVTLPEQQTRRARRYRKPGVGRRSACAYRSKQSMQPEPVIRVLLIDDHAGVRLTLGTGLRAQQLALAVLMLSIYHEEVSALRTVKHAAAGYRTKRIDRNLARRGAQSTLGWQIHHASARGAFRRASRRRQRHSACNNV